MADLLDVDVSRLRGKTHGRTIESHAALFWSKKRWRGTLMHLHWHYIYMGNSLDKEHVRDELDAVYDVFII